MEYLGTMIKLLSNFCFSDVPYKSFLPALEQIHMCVLFYPIFSSEVLEKGIKGL